MPRQTLGSERGVDIFHSPFSRSPAMLLKRMDYTSRRCQYWPLREDHAHPTLPLGPTLGVPESYLKRLDPWHNGGSKEF